MSTRYEIEVKEITEEYKKRGKEWKKGVNPLNPEEYGYTPEISRLVTIDRVILTQNVDTFDLVAVIKAINLIP